MAKHPNSRSTTFAPAMFLVLLLAMTECISSSRVLLDVQPAPAAAPPAMAPQPYNANHGATNPSAVASPTAPSQANAASPVSNPATNGPPPSMAPSSVVTPEPADPATIPTMMTPPEVSPALQQLPAASGAAGTVQPLTFFLHDVLGASELPSAYIPGNANGVNPASNGTPMSNAMNSPETGTAPQSSLPLGRTVAIDEELAEVEQKGANGNGRAQGFYVASSQDGTSLMLMLTATFQGGGEGCADALSFFGVYCTTGAVSNIAIVGGTGKYVDAKGYATVQAVHLTGQQNAAQDGAETLLQFSIYIS